MASRVPYEPPTSVNCGYLSAVRMASRSSTDALVVYWRRSDVASSWCGTPSPCRWEETRRSKTAAGRADHRTGTAADSSRRCRAGRHRRHHVARAARRVPGDESPMNSRSGLARSAGKIDDRIVFAPHAVLLRGWQDDDAKGDRAAAFGRLILVDREAKAAGLDDGDAHTRLFDERPGRLGSLGLLDSPPEPIRAASRAAASVTPAAGRTMATSCRDATRCTCARTRRDGARSPSRPSCLLRAPHPPSARRARRAGWPRTPPPESPPCSG